MAKHKNKHRPPQPTAPKPVVAVPPIATSAPAPSVSVTTSSQDITTPALAVAAISTVHGQSIETATEADITVASSAPSPIVPEIDLVQAARELWEAHALCKARAERMLRLEDGEKALAAAQVEIEKDRGDLDSTLASISEREAAAKTAEEELRAREDALRVSMLNAEAGFAKERRESLTLLEDEAEVLRKSMSEARKTIADERARWDAEWRQAEEASKARIDALRAQWEAEQAEATQRLDADRRQSETELSRLRAELKKQRAQLDVREDVLREDREAFEARVAERAGAALEQATARIGDLETRLAEARRERDDLYGQLREREDAVRALGNKPLEEIKRELDALRKENKALQDRLAKQPSAGAVDRLQELEQAREEWEADRARLSQELLSSRAATARSAIAVTELESLRDQKAALESSRDLLQAALEELRKDVDERIRRSDGVSPFPSCSQMDEDDELQSTVPSLDEIDNLADFCVELQQRVALDPDSGKELYYSLSDIRCFLAGMATSRLHLLQGISGTGKTSLPLAIARALGAGSALIEVQAGWRDRQDLIGHFNAFERRFYESEFLQALYRAQCPRFADLPFIVVLDEMNLSHPEQYFADLLSALEQDPQYQKLDLMTAAVDPAPALLRDGRTLPLPQNVWFVGTANHDETTKDFADKTYDRAHVMELPRHRESFKPKRLRARAPVAMAGLQAAFAAAQTAHQRKATEAYRFLDDRFADVLGKRFRVGWGNRLERQMMNFVPVVLAAGGSVAEAVDHVLATKLLRKIRDRHDTRPDDLEALRTALDDAWPLLRSEDKPGKSMGIVQSELRRLGADEAA